MELMLCKSASVTTSLYRCGRKTWTMWVSELRWVNTTDTLNLVEGLLALIMGYRLWGSKEATLTEAQAVASSNRLPRSIMAVAETNK